jgi:hypothetical protein
MVLFALRAQTGRFSQIFHSREDLEDFVHQQGIANAEVGLVTFTPICSIRATIEIPWGEGFGSLKDRLEQSGVRSEEPKADDSTLRSEGESKAGNTTASPKSKPGRRRASLSSNGEASS